METFVVRFALFLTALGFSVCSLSAQDVTGLEPGSRVRLTTTNCFDGVSPFVWSFLSFDGNTVWAGPPAGRVGCPISQISKLEVGEFSRVGNALWGTLILGGASAVLAGFLLTSTSIEYDAYGYGETVTETFDFTNAMKWGLIMGGLGFTVGWAFPPKVHWKSVNLPPARPSLKLSMDGRAQIGFSFARRR